MPDNITEIPISPVGRVDAGNPTCWLNQRTTHLYYRELSGFAGAQRRPTVNPTYELRLPDLQLTRLTCYWCLPKTLVSLMGQAEPTPSFSCYFLQHLPKNKIRYKLKTPNSDLQKGHNNEENNIVIIGTIMNKSNQNAWCISLSSFISNKQKSRPVTITTNLNLNLLTEPITTPKSLFSTMAGLSDLIFYKFDKVSPTFSC